MFSLGNIIGLIMVVVAVFFLLRGKGLAALNRSWLWLILVAAGGIGAAYFYSVKDGEGIAEVLGSISSWLWIPPALLLLFLVYKGLGKTKIDINMVVKIVLIFGGLIMFVGVLSALYHDIMGTTHEMGRSKLEYGPEIRVNLVPDVMAQLGHREEIRVSLDPDFRIIELTAPLSVWRTEGNRRGEFLVYFGSKRAGVARIPGLKVAVNIYKIHYNLPEATLPRGTLIKFSPHEKPEIIFSAPGSLAFGNGKTVLAYREVK